MFSRCNNFLRGKHKGYLTKHISRKSEKQTLFTHHQHTFYKEITSYFYGRYTAIQECLKRINKQHTRSVRTCYRALHSILEHNPVKGLHR